MTTINHQTQKTKNKNLKNKLLACLCPCFHFQLQETEQMQQHIPSKQEDSHSTIHGEPPRFQPIINQLIHQMSEHEAGLTEGEKISKIHIHFKEQLFFEQQEADNYDEMEQEYEKYLNKSKEIKKISNPIDEMPENVLFIVGGKKGKMLCKIKKICIEPSQFSMKKQKEADVNYKKCSDPVIEKYWQKRYFLFQKFDEGIKLDQQSWFSVTPEAVAQHIASRLQGFEKVLDGFCGAGGDSIQLAMNCKQVYSNDIDEVKINCLLNNAAIYGVDNIEPSVMNFFDLQFKRRELDAVYLAPPWGGIDYFKKAKLLPEDFTPSLTSIIQKAFQFSDNLALFLPVNTQIQNLVQVLSQSIQQLNSVNNSCSLSIQKIYYSGAFKFILVWVGNRISGINLSDELQYIYRLLGNGQSYFKHRRVVKKIREEYGMLKLLNLILQCQKKNLNKQNNLFQCFKLSLISQSLITKEKIQKLIEAQQKDAEKQGKKQIKKSKIMMKSMMQKKKQCTNAGNGSNLRVSNIEGQMVRVSKRQDNKIEQTVSYISSINQSQLIGTVNVVEPRQSTGSNQGVRIEQISQSEESFNSQN